MLKTRNLLVCFLAFNALCVSAYVPSTRKQLINPHAFSSRLRIANSQVHTNPLSIRGGSLDVVNPLTRRKLVLNPVVISLISGSVAGAIGVGKC